MSIRRATSDVGSYFDFSANDRGEDARNAIVAALRAMGVPIASAHHEHGAGQHEIDVAHDDPLAAADHALTLRTIAKHVAADFDLEATFMPKPLADRAGSGLHADFRLAGVERRGDDAVRRRRTTRARCGNDRHLQSDGQLIQASRRGMGRADLRGLVGAQCEHARAGPARACSGAHRDAQPRSGVQSVSRARRAHRRGIRRHRSGDASRDRRSSVRRTI